MRLNSRTVFLLVLSSFLYFIVHMCECHTLTYLFTYLLTYLLRHRGFACVLSKL